MRVGIASGLGKKIKQVLVKHARQFPDVDVRCKDILSTRQNDALAERQIDVGLLRPPVKRQRLVSELLFDEQFLVFLSKRHPLARRRKLNLKQLASETLLLYDRNQSAGVFDKTLELYRRAGLSPKILFTATHHLRRLECCFFLPGKESTWAWAPFLPIQLDPVRSPQFL